MPIHVWRWAGLTFHVALEKWSTSILTHLIMANVHFEAVSHRKGKFFCSTQFSWKVKLFSHLSDGSFALASSSLTGGIWDGSLWVFTSIDDFNQCPVLKNVATQTSSGISDILWWVFFHFWIFCVVLVVTKTVPLCTKYDTYQSHPFEIQRCIPWASMSLQIAYL